MGKLNDAYIKSKEFVARKAKEAGKDHPVQHSEHDRLPPGQYLTEKFPVLDLGYQPMFFEQKYRFDVTGLVESPISLTYEELKKLPKNEVVADFHCVTKWSRYDLKWRGVLMKDILELVKPKSEAKFVIQYGLDDYTTNVPIEAVNVENAIIAYELEDEPLPREHGGPLRMIIPQLYGWKGSKFLTKLEFVEKDKLGFWEVRGYSNIADPWTEDRYS